ncbi:VOC family protein [Mucilaginibacter sp. X4EP1]|uniref:VOC family protein n=1 Tax=Mucilaginibacter sp. X4EP1 TaxID=2723092 RepID=UPI00216A8F43|nr:VOC family protein [Mucilaginibacter sp. X4EP1]MCS3813201.1 PhnB protein [Mucilaginibacter sp. X4EP1]
MASINPYVGFNGECRKAMEFYKECLGGELFFQTVGSSPMAEQCPSGMKDNILHSSLSNGSMVLMATDMVTPDGYTKGNNISLSLNCSSEEEINTFFTKLSAGGKVLDPLKEQFWGAIFGALTDQFGINWMLNCNKKP